jgi:hypothetical protein
MLALLEPDSRAPTFQAWLAHDDHPGTKFGHGMGNGYPMDCSPIGKGGSKWGVGCSFPNSSFDDSASQLAALPPPPPPLVEAAGPEYGFYCCEYIHHCSLAKVPLFLVPPRSCLLLLLPPLR